MNYHFAFLTIFTCFFIDFLHQVKFELDINLDIFFSMPPMPQILSILVISLIE